MSSFIIFLCGMLSMGEMPPAPGQEQPAPKLNIVIVDGEGAINNIRQRTAREPIVQVEDENHRPIAGAAVVFTLPSNGAGGVFADGSQTFTTVTDAQGRAVASGLKPNQIAGRVEIRVNASSQGRTGRAVITQTNVLGAKAGHISSKAAIIAAVAAAALAGIVCAFACSGGGGSSSSSSTTSTPGTVITPGGGTVGPPR